MSQCSVPFVLSFVDFNTLNRFCKGQIGENGANPPKLAQKVLHQDLRPDGDQHQTARQFRPGLESGTEKATHPDSDGGEEKRGRGDDGRGLDHIHIQKCEGNAHRQRVDAGGHRKGQHGQRLKGRIGTGIRFPGFHNHLSADERQQQEYDPMVEISNKVAECGAHKITDQRHPALKYAKPQSGDQGLDCGFLLMFLLYGKAFANGHSEGVHGQTYRYKQQF